MPRLRQDDLPESSSASRAPLTFFFGGVHGAGKSTVSRELARIFGVSHMTAGGLIKENAKTNYQAMADLRAVPDVQANQMLLLGGLARYRLDDNGPLILDGHFVLIEPGGTFAEIPTVVFDAIAPVAVILIEAAPETVHARLLDRDREALPIPAIAELSMRERLHAERVCKHLKLSLVKVSTDGTATEAVASATSLIRTILEERH